MMFEVYCIYGRENEFTLINNVLDDYHWFFKLQAHANRFSAFVYLAGALTSDRPDAPPHKRTINLRDLLAECQDDGLLGASEAFSHV